MTTPGLQLQATGKPSLQVSAGLATALAISILAAPGVCVTPGVTQIGAPAVVIQSPVEIAIVPTPRPQISILLSQAPGPIGPPGPGGGGDLSQLVLASELLPSGSLVNLWNNGGTPNARLADNATLKQADGFVNAATLQGQLATVLGIGFNTQLGGLTPGSSYYLGASGGVTLAPPDPTQPSQAGKLVQPIGVAWSDTTMFCDLIPPTFL